MNRIQVLPDEVINRIAAGEVVERPASVVKELVENALDAGADRITVELDEGGCRRITVTDDGCGMNPEDARRALQRHATSKISCADDLFSIATMGFRGEALASIASVGRLSLLTREAEGEGIKLTTDGGEKVREMPWNADPGTTITLSDLFFNFPARQKFLKSPATEYSHCLELIQAIALCNPGVGFILHHNGREQLAVPPVEGGEQPPWRGEQVLRQRCARVIGADTVDSLIYVRKTSQYGTLEALVSPPGIEKASAKYMFNFVNGRWVKDKTLRYGILRGYHSHLLKGRFPVVVAYLTLDSSLVDVNVHPAKTELRFQYPGEVQSMLAFAIRDQLRAGEWARTPGAETAAAFFNRGTTPVNMPDRDFDLNTSSAAGRSANGLLSSGTGSVAPSYRGEPVIKRTVTSFDGYGGAPLFAHDGDVIGTSADPVDERPIPWRELKHLGTFARCYLLFEARDRLLVVDQHAFHERILFERLCRDASLLGRTQALLVPHGVDLSPAEVAALRDAAPNLAGRGFAFDFPGETTVEVRSMPALLSGCDVDALLVSLASAYTDGETSVPTAELASRLLATIACHGAVRAGEELGEQELRRLLNEAGEVDFHLNCPHGRRVFKWWTLRDVSNWFDRT